ncbi:MAG TPA: hypothetical protein PK816_15555, partial [Candidatus Cloacimonadota bacterium]|nr:hypothetical protein [Candidatus Cloacimonadota bacterium]
MIFNLDDINKVVFRTNAGETIGSGHLNRCLALASKFKKSYNNIKIIWIVNEEAKSSLLAYQEVFIFNDYNNNDVNFINQINPDIIIIDSYIPDHQY